MARVHPPLKPMPLWLRVIVAVLLLLNTLTAPVAQIVDLQSRLSATATSSGAMHCHDQTNPGGSAEAASTQEKACCHPGHCDCACRLLAAIFIDVLKLPVRMPTTPDAQRSTIAPRPSPLTVLLRPPIA